MNWYYTADIWLYSNLRNHGWILYCMTVTQCRLLRR